VSGWASLGAVIGGVKNIPALRWANPLDIKNAVERVFTQAFGAKEAAKPKAKVNDIDHIVCCIMIP
jgi:glutaminyl-tRNA synthetase